MKNKKIKYTFSLVITIIGLLSLFVGTSYAMLKGMDTTDSEQVIKAGSVELKLTEKFESIDKKITVMSDVDGLVQDTTYDFNLKNIGSEPAKFDIKLINNVPNSYTGEVLDIDYFRVGLEINGEEHGPMSLQDVKSVIDSDVIYKGEIINYKMRIWLDEEKSEELKEMEDYKAFLKLEVEAEQRVEEMDTLDKTTVFNYTGDVQEYEVPRDGYYYIEMAGAGDTVSNEYSKGGLTSGYIELKCGEKLYFYVGAKGNTFNGGGYSSPQGYLTSACDTGGNGATDVRLVSGSWDNTSSLISRIMVAGAGGRGNSSIVGSPSGVAQIYGDTGNGGGLFGISGTYAYNSSYSTVREGGYGTQIAGGAGGVSGYSTSSTGGDGSFGKGGTGGVYQVNSANAMCNGFGGAGGYYGSGGSAGGRTGYWGPAGSSGGSSYISGFAGVNSVEESTTITHTNQTLHYSGKYFVGGTMVAGVNSGNGYAKIMYVEKKPKKTTTKLNNIRYIKNCTNYNTVNAGNHWLEIQAIRNGLNLAKGKSVSGTVAGSSTKPYSRITDGDITPSTWSDPVTQVNNSCVTVDLEQNYDLDEVAVWNYFGDKRVYYDNKTYVSSDNQNWTIITGATYENSNGHRLNAYSPSINFEYVGDAQEYIVPSDGYYKIELWGAQGGGNTTSTGYAGYTKGTIHLKENEKLYFYVGEGLKTTTNTTSFNGGTGNSGGYPGGGATDVRLISGNWNDIASLRSRIMVAAGSGSVSTGTSGSAGGLTGYAGGGTAGGTQVSYGAVQASGYTVSSFGVANGGCAGGNGYYPGGGSTCASGAGGGSSYISGHTGSVAIASSSSTSPRTGTNGASCTTGTSDNLCSVHYSKKVFTDTVMIDGKGYSWSNTKGGYQKMPSYTSTDAYYDEGKGHIGYGYARITPINETDRTYLYTNKEEKYIVEKTGAYNIELWGAKGGYSKYSTSYNGGKASYTSGNINLNKGDILYFYVGGYGTSVTGTTSATVYNNGYNSGSGGTFYPSNSTHGGGGGATDVRLVDSSTDSIVSLRSRIMVAAGGGGSSSHASTPSYSGTGGAGGGLTGYSGVTGNTTCYSYGSGGSQISGGTYVTCTSDGRSGASSYKSGFGNGGGENSNYYTSSAVYAGGGGGYYGGEGGYHAPAGGGSSYISGHTGCVAVTSEKDTTAKSGCTTGTSDNSCSIHYSNKKFANTIMIDGKGYSWSNIKGQTREMPNPYGGFYAVGEGHNYSGFARITFVD